MAQMPVNPLSQSSRLDTVSLKEKVNFERLVKQQKDSFKFGTPLNIAGLKTEKDGTTNLATLFETATSKGVFGSRGSTIKAVNTELAAFDKALTREGKITNLEKAIEKAKEYILKPNPERGIGVMSFIDLVENMGGPQGFVDALRVLNTVRNNIDTILKKEDWVQQLTVTQNNDHITFIQGLSHLFQGKLPENPAAFMSCVCNNDINIDGNSLENILSPWKASPVLNQLTNKAAFSFEKQKLPLLQKEQREELNAILKDPNFLLCLCQGIEKGGYFNMDAVSRLLRG